MKGVNVKRNKKQYKKTTKKTKQHKTNINTLNAPKTEPGIITKSLERNWNKFLKRKVRIAGIISGVDSPEDTLW